jgi:hypothetical protein
MRKIREVLRLHYEHKLGQRQIARGANVSQSTVHEYLARAMAAGLKWPLPEEWDEQRLEAGAVKPLFSKAGRTQTEPRIESWLWGKAERLVDD